MKYINWLKEQETQSKEFIQVDREKQQKSMQAQQQAAEKNKSLEKKVVNPGAGEVTKENILSLYLEFIQEVSPPGWEGSIKKMKKKRGIKNVWALGWWMKKKGYSPHYTKSGRKK